MSKTTKTTVDPLTVSPNKVLQEYSNPHDLSVKEMKFILSIFNFLLMGEIVETGVSFILPSNLGCLGIVRVPVHGKGVFDYELFKHTGIKRYHRNNNSGQEVAIFKWWKRYPYYKNLPSANVYQFKASRYWKRTLAHRMKTDKSILSYPYDY